MALHKMEFFNSLARYEYKGDGRFLFRILDRENSGFLAYQHFDPCGALDLALLTEWCTTKYGSVQQAFTASDQDRNGTLSLREFQNAVEGQGCACSRAVTYLFEMLDLDADRKIRPDEIEFLDRWKCPGWLRTTPDEEGLQEFKARLLKEFDNNPIKAWNLGIDTDHNMRVSWDEFEAVCRTKHVAKAKWESVWRAMDGNLSGWVSLKEFDEGAYAILKRFKSWCDEHFKNVYEAFSALDNNRRGSVSRKKFQPVVDDLNLNESDADLLFNGLDLHGKGHIAKKDVRYLHNWDLDGETEEDVFWDIIATTLHSRLLKDRCHTQQMSHTKYNTM